MRVVVSHQVNKQWTADYQNLERELSAMYQQQLTLPTSREPHKNYHNYSRTFHRNVRGYRSHPNCRRFGSVLRYKLNAALL